MGRVFCTTVSVGLICLVFGSSPVNAQCDFTISASGTSPFVNSGPLTTDTLELHFWFVCEHSGAGTSAVSGAISVPPGVAVVGFTPAAGALNVGDEINFLIAFGGCSGETMLIGTWEFANAVPGDYCLTEHPTEGFLAAPDCDCLGCPAPVPAYQIGYSAGGTAAGCMATDGFQCLPTTSADSETWGAVKDLYR